MSGDVFNCSRSESDAWADFEIIDSKHAVDRFQVLLKSDEFEITAAASIF